MRMQRRGFQRGLRAIGAALLLAATLAGRLDAGEATPTPAADPADAGSPDAGSPDAADPKAASADENGLGVTTPQDLVRGPVAPEEKVLHETLLRSLRESAPAIAALRETQNVQFLGLRDACVMGLEQNLGIHAAGEDIAIQKALVDEARAVFLPTFTFSVYERKDKSHVREDKNYVTKDYIPFRFPYFTQVDGTGLSDVEGIWWQAGSNSFTAFENEKASSRDKSRKPYYREMEASVTQVLPWGPEVSLAVTSRRQTTYYNTHDKLTYHKPWTSSAVLTLDTPLPFTKGFGPNSANDYSLAQAAVAGKRADWTLRVVINATILTVDHAYWDLVAAAERLKVNIDNRDLVAALVEQSAKLEEAKRATAYDRNQMEAELARAEADVQTAWNAVMVASHALGAQLNAPAGALILPAGYSTLKEKVVERPNRVTAMDTALATRAEIAVARVDTEGAELLVHFWRNQTRYEMNYTLRIEDQQDSTVFGYDTLDDSLNSLLIPHSTKNFEDKIDDDVKQLMKDQNEDVRYAHGLGKPDVRLETHTLLFRHTLGRTASRAGLRQASNTAVDANLAFRQTERFVAREVEDALTAVAAATRGLQVSRERQAFAKKAYDAASALRQSGRVREFELVAKQRELLAADQAVIAAEVALRKTESQLAAAMGTLPKTYGEMTCATEFEEHRLLRLTLAKLRRFF